MRKSAVLRYGFPGGLGAIDLVAALQGWVGEALFGFILAIALLWLLLSVVTNPPTVGRYPALLGFAEQVAPYLEPLGFRFEGTLGLRLRRLETQGEQLRDAIETKRSSPEKRREVIQRWLDEVAEILKSEAPHLYLIYESPDIVSKTRWLSTYEARNSRLSYEGTLALNGGPSPTGRSLSGPEITDLVALNERLDGLNAAIRQLEGITVLSVEKLV